MQHNTFTRTASTALPPAGSVPARALVTVLAACNNGLATKTHTQQPDGTFETADYNVGSRFGWRVAEATSIHGLANIIRGLAHNEFIVAGQVQRPHNDDGTRRDIIARKGDELFPHVDGVRRSRGARVRCWGMLDFDGVAVPEHFDLATEGADAIEWAIYEYLPACFHDVTCYWQLSSNTGIKPGLRAHVWFFFDRAVPGGLVGDYFTAEGTPVDKVVFTNDVQPHYSLPPVFKNCPDPILNRDGILEREHDFVTLPELNRQTLVAQARAQGVGNALLDDALGVEAKIALVGDGDGLDGFHRPITAAIMSAVGSARRRGLVVDADELKKRLRDAIETAPRAPGRDILRYLEDAYLDGSIAGAIRRAEQPQDHGQEDAALPAYYPRAAHTLDEAQEAVSNGMEKFLKAAAGYWQAMAEWAKECEEDPDNPFTVKPEPQRYLLAPPPGVGKTTAVVSNAGTIKKEYPKKAIGLSSPRHALNEETAAALRTAMGDEFVVEIHRGRGAEDPENPGETMCRIPDLAEEVVSAGGDVLKMLCGTPRKPHEGLCPHYYECGTQRQRQKTADIWLFAHHLLTHEKPGNFEDLSCVFVDENCTNVFLKGVSGHPITLTWGEIYDVIAEMERISQASSQASRPGRAADWEADRVVLRELLTELEKRPVGPLKTAGLPGAKGIYTATWRTKKELRIAPNTTPTDRAAELKIKGAYNKGISRVATLGRLVACAEGETVPGVTVVDGGVKLAWRKEIGKGWDVPVMFMDGTAAPAIYEEMFGVRPENVAAITCEAPHMTVRQVTDWNGSRKKLVPNDGKEDIARTARNNVARLRRYIEHRAHEFRGQGALVDGKAVDVLVVSYKATVELLEARGLPEGVETAYYGNLTGLDGWKGVRCIVLAGGAAVGVADIEREAEVIKGAPLAPLDHSFANWYAKEMVGGRRRGMDTGPALGREYHNDPIAEAVRWTKTEGELIQAYGRGREVRRTADTPLQLDILTNRPLPVEVDEFVQWKDIQPDPYGLMAARGVVMDCPSNTKGYWGVVQAVLPDVFSNLQAAKDWAQNAVTVEFAYREIYIGELYREGDLLPALAKITRYAVPVLIRAGTDTVDVFGPAAVIEYRGFLRPTDIDGDGGDDASGVCGSVTRRTDSYNHTPLQPAENRHSDQIAAKMPKRITAAIANGGWFPLSTRRLADLPGHLHPQQSADGLGRPWRHHRRRGRRPEDGVSDLRNHHGGRHAPAPRRCGPDRE